MRIFRFDNVPYAFGLYCLAVGYFINPERADFAALITFIPGVVFILALAISYGINLFHPNFYVSLVISVILLFVIICTFIGTGRALDIPGNLPLWFIAIWLFTGISLCRMFSRRLCRHGNFHV